MKRLVVLLTMVTLLFGSLSSAALASSNATKKQVDAKLVAATDKVMQQWASRDDAKLEKELVKLGWTKLPSKPQVSIMSSPGAGIVTPKGIFRAGDGAYLVQGDWSWSSSADMDIEPRPEDYFALGLTDSSNNAIKDASPTSMNMAIYDQFGTSYRTYGNPSIISQSGATYTVSDQWKSLVSSSYIGYSGSIWYYLPYKPADVSNVRLMMEWKHTYTTGLTIGTLFSVSLGWPWTLTATFTKATPLQWSAVQALYIPSTSW